MLLSWSKAQAEGHSDFSPGAFLKAPLLISISCLWYLTEGVSKSGILCPDQGWALSGIGTESQGNPVKHGWASA